MLGERLRGLVGEVGADGPAIRGRSARHIIEVVVLRGVGRGDDGPRCPVPMLDERVAGLVFDDAGVIGADGPAIRRRSARYPTEVVVLRGARVGRGTMDHAVPFQCSMSVWLEMPTR